MNREVRFNPRLGCGHSFSHDESKANSAEAHTCPECGRGPFYVRLPPAVEAA